MEKNAIKKKKYKKSNKNNYITDKDYQTPIFKINDKNHIKTKYIYIYNSYSNNFIYFICNKRRKCFGIIKTDKKEIN